MSHIRSRKAFGREVLLRQDLQGNGRKAVEHGWRQCRFMGLAERQSKAKRLSMSVCYHADFCAIAIARAAKCFTMVSLFERAPFLGAPAALW
ncbi:hypothetical protein A0U89_14705 (plasmid) [Kozakia baliensis]|uniref:Uncharacterized protein n=1 Tax=Kozakia baliensis TaxID=153496 RepID=A0A1D8UYA8_9PROT|nr:hypothetical protein A0U89_14705 [Kozakia baliensis]